MPSSKAAIRRSARRIGAEHGANFEERREIIVLEAVRAFNENGVKNTSIDDIAGRLGVTKPAIYHYIPSKNQLITQCLDMAMKSGTEIMDRASAYKGNGLEKLSYGLRKWAEFVATDFGRAIVMIDLKDLNKESRDFHLQTQRQMVRRAKKIVEQGIADGSIRPCNSTVIGLGLLALFNSPAHWFSEDGELSFEEAIEEFMCLITHGLSP